MKDLKNQVGIWLERRKLFWIRKKNLAISKTVKFIFS